MSRNITITNIIANGTKVQHNSDPSQDAPTATSELGSWIVCCLLVAPLPSLPLSLSKARVHEEGPSLESAQENSDEILCLY